MRGVTVNTVSASAFERRNQLVLLDIEMPLDAAANSSSRQSHHRAPTSAADRSRTRSKSPATSFHQ
jgi:hypothetical protein